MVWVWDTMGRSMVLCHGSGLPESTLQGLWVNLGSYGVGLGLWDPYGSLWGPLG